MNQKNEVSTEDKIKIIIGIIITFIVIGLIGLYVYFEFFNCNYEPKEPDIKIAYRQEENRFIFYNQETGNIISQYHCLNNQCSVGQIGDILGNELPNNLFLIIERSDDLINPFVLFHILEGQVITKTNLLAFAGQYHYVFRYNANFGILDLYGNKVTEVIFDGMDVHSHARAAVGGLNNNYIAAAKNGKWGLVELATGEPIIYFMHDRLHAFNSDYVSIKRNNEWYILNIYNSDAFISGGYQEVVILGDFYLGSRNNLINLYNTDGEQLTNINIPLGNPFSQIVCHTGHGMNLAFEGSDYLIITIDYESHNHDHSHNNIHGNQRVWQFNINTREINER